MNPRVVGVTGSIGAGKSTVAALICERLAAMKAQPLLIDADRMVHEFFEAESKSGPIKGGLFDQIAMAFGSEVIRSDGTLDRALLAQRGFSDEVSAEKLSSIIHPRVIAETKRRIADHKGAVLLDVPLLFESGMDRLCDATIVVTAPSEVRRSRSRFSDMERRERFQMPEREKAARASFLLENGGSKEELSAEIKELVAKIWPAG